MAPAEALVDCGRLGGGAVAAVGVAADVGADELPASSPSSMVNLMEEVHDSRPAREVREQLPQDQRAEMEQMHRQMLDATKSPGHNGRSAPPHHR